MLTNKERIVYLASPAQAIAPLEHLLSLPEYEVVAVVSQPAKFIGRGRDKEPEDPPVARFAKEQGLLTLQPASPNTQAFLEQLRELAPNVMVTCAYGKILSEEFLSCAKRAVINIHPSDLPQFRGATPVQQSLLAGHLQTTVCVLFTVRELDAGNIIVKEEFAIGAHETAQDLQQRLFASSGKLLSKALSMLKDAHFSGTAQDLSKLSFCKKIQKEDGQILWQEQAEAIYNKFRAFCPWPGSYSFLQGKRVLFASIRPVVCDALSLAPGGFVLRKEAGESFLVVATGEGFLRVDRLKVEGSKSDRVVDFWNRLKNSEEKLFSTNLEK